MKTILLFTTMLFTSSFIGIQKDTITAYLTGSQTLWVQAVKLAATVRDNDPTEENLFDLIIVEYGLVNATMQNKNEELFDEYVDVLEDHMDELEDQGHRIYELKAIKSAVTGLSIAYSPWKGMMLGPKAGYLIDEAIAEAPEAALVQKLYGNYLFFTPEMWGGDLSEAVTNFERAIASYEKDGETSNWMYLDANAWLGQAYMKQGKTQKAIEIFEKVLEIQPDFVWIRENLLPAAKNS